MLKEKKEEDSTASEESDDSASEFGASSGPVIIPNYGGISVLSFTNSFSFSIIPGLEPRNRAFSIPAPKPQSTESMTKALSSNSKKKNKIADMSRKMNQR